MTNASHFSLLVVDDEPDLRTLYELTLLREGYDIETAGTVQDALLHLKDRTYSAVITDMRLPDGTGLDVLRWLEESGRREKTIVITAYGSAENAVEALQGRRLRLPHQAGRPEAVPRRRRFGARAAAAAAADHRPGTCRRDGAPPAAAAAAAGRARRAAAGAGEPGARRGWPASSSAMQQVRSLVDKVARSMAPVLVNGESGTGKELVARAIHEVSARGAQPFVPVNCSAIPEQLLEAEFFGYRKGAFTGANGRPRRILPGGQRRHAVPRRDRRPAAGDASPSCCARSRSGRVRPVGAVSEESVNVRLLSATHKDLGAEVHAGQFRQDLYYRLNVIQIRVPPLRERLEDLVVDQRARARAPRARRRRLAGAAPDPRRAGPSRRAIRFPATCASSRTCCTVRSRCRAAKRSTSTTSACPNRSSPTAPRGARPDRRHARAAYSRPCAALPLVPVEEPLPDDLERYLDEVERDILVRALEHHRFNRTAAGASLGLSLRQMRYRMARLQRQRRR